MESNEKNNALNTNRHVISNDKIKILDSTQLKKEALQKTLSDTTSAAFYIQVNVYQDKSNAGKALERLNQQLKERKGRMITSKGTLYKIVIEGFETRAAAKSFVKTYERDLPSAIVVNAKK